MARRFRIAVVIAAAAVGVAAGLAKLRSSGEAPAGSSPVSPRAGGSGAAVLAAPSARLVPPRRAVAAGVTITGRVVDVGHRAPVGNVEVVFRGDEGETSTTARPDGQYSIRVAAGSYRAFVRGDAVVSVGRAGRVRLPDLPSAETAGVPDEGLMAVIAANGDADGIDLAVVRGGVVSGQVVDGSGRPIPGAVLRARSSGARPTLGTDVAESDSGGNFELRLPAGSFLLEASHPRFAGIANPAEARFAVAPGDHVIARVALTTGCIITGRVVGRNGKPAGDGAIERIENLSFAPAGRVEPDGTFRWATTDSAEITIRAWPWKSPPSPARRFDCRDGARFTDVVFQLPDRRPDLEGVLVDRAGEPVGFAYVDVIPLDRGGIAQQERADDAGRWAVYDLEPGRYRIVAQADAHGLTTTTVASPRGGIRLELGGTGRLEGTTTRLASGSFELVLDACLDSTGQVPLPQARRLVTVTGGQFVVDGLPACLLAFNAIWHGKPLSHQVDIPSGGTARIELDLGPVVSKTVHGVVRDSAGRPLARATGPASPRGNADAFARTDAAGAYTIAATSGTSLRASLLGRIGTAQVGGASIDREQVDIVVDDADGADHR